MSNRRLRGASTAFFAATACLLLASCSGSAHVQKLRSSDSKTQVSADKVSNVKFGNASATANNAPGAGESLLVSAGTSKPRLADRVYVNSLLQAVFGPTVAPVIAPLVTTNVASFGGPCDPFGPGGTYCHGDFSSSLAAMMPTTMATRSGYQMLACERIATMDPAIANAVALIPSASVTVLPDAAATAAAYSLFYRGQDPSPAVQTALAKLTTGQPPADGWRYLFLTLCLSPDWQLL